MAGTGRLGDRRLIRPARGIALSARFGGACVARLTADALRDLLERRWPGIRRADAQGKRCKLGTDGLCFVLVLVQSRQMHR